MPRTSAPVCDVSGEIAQSSTACSIVSSDPGTRFERKDNSLLAGRAVERRASALHESPHGAGASRRHAALAFAVIDAEVMLEVAELTIGLTVVAQRRAAGLDRILKHRADRADQLLGALVGRARAGRDCRRQAFWRQARLVQRLAHIDVAEPCHYLLVRQRGLEAGLLVVARS